MDIVEQNDWDAAEEQLTDDDVKIYQQLDRQVIYKDAETNPEVAECLKIFASQIEAQPALLVVATQRNQYNNGWLAKCIET